MGSLCLGFPDRQEPADQDFGTDFSENSPKSVLSWQRRSLPGKVSVHSFGCLKGGFRTADDRTNCEWLAIRSIWMISLFPPLKIGSIRERQVLHGCHGHVGSAVQTIHHLLKKVLPNRF